MPQDIERCYFPTIQDLLRLPQLQTSVLVAGEQGLGNIITGTNQTDDKEYMHWISEGELMISTLLEIFRDEAAMREYIPNLARAGMSGVCIKAHNYLHGVIPQYMIDQGNELGFPIISLPIDAQFSKIVRVITDETTRRRTHLLQNIIQVNQILTQSITEGADLDKIASTIAALCAGSVMIVDTINDIHSIYLQERDTLDLSELSEAQRINVVASKSQCHELKVGDSSYGFLYLYHPQENSMMSPELLSQILATIPLVITREQSKRESGNSLFASFFLHLLTDPIRDETAEQTRASQFGINLPDNHLIFHLQAKDKNSSPNEYRKNFQNTLLLGRLRTTLSKLSLQLHIVNTGSEYIILLSSPAENDELKNILSYLPELISSIAQDCPELRITCGYGCIHPGLHGLSQSDKEAKIAIKHAEQLDRINVRYEDLGLMRLIHSADPNRECLAFVEEILGPIIENDRVRHSDLMKTLDAYFEYSGNAKMISEKLFTHYNTICYRLKNIQELTKKSFRVREERFMLETALELYKYYYSID